MPAPPEIRTPADTVSLPSVPNGPESTWRWLTAELAGQLVPPVIGVIGLGDGSLLEALDVQAPGAKVLALEPDPSTARAVMAMPRTQAWRQSGRLLYLFGPDFAGADNAWRIFPSRVEAPPMLVHPSAVGVAGVAKAISVFRKVLFGAVANSNARRKFAPRYLLNTLKNLPAIVNGRDVRALTDAAVGIPAVVVGAGPSLDASMDELESLRDRAILIATDTALRPLLARGIVPQIVVGLDPSDLNARHLLALPECRGTWLVAESALDPRATAAFEGRTFWFRVAPHHPWPWYNEQGIDVGRLDVWGSVLTGAFQIARLAGCDPIVTVGADLSFPGGRPYARGTTYEFDWAWAAAFGTPVEQTWRTLMAGRNDLRTEKDFAGVDTPTTGAMLQFRDWMVAQARKSGRRFVNASGAGMLFGDGVEQARLSEVLTEDVTLPALEAQGRPTTAASRKALARMLRTLRAELAAARTDKWPLSGWRDFSGEGFDPGPVGSALESAALQLEGSRRSATKRRATRPEAERDGVSGLAGLPESATRLRLSLRGELTPALDGVDTTPSDRTSRLCRSLELLKEIVSSAMSEPDFVSFPDPTLIGEVSAGGICMWPETTRWTVQRFETQLAHAWNHVVTRPSRPAVAFGEVLPRESSGGPTKLVGTTRPHAAHACLLLVVEWLRCAASVGAVEAAALADAINRLWALEQWLRNTKPDVQAGTQAELLIEAKLAGAGEGTTTVVLPLGVSEAALARVLTGTMQTEGEAVWELARTTGGVTIRVGVREQRTHEREWRSPRAVAVTPRPIGAGGNARLKIADQAPEGALCVVDFTPNTVVVTSDGRRLPYGTWPKPVTGALTLCEHGEVAWSQMGPSAAEGHVSYLMHRAGHAVDVSVISLPFRPARGLWWRGRLYLTSLPTADAKGGIGSWAPGEEVRLEWPDSTLQGILPLGDSLGLEPHILGAAERPLRRRATYGWTWTPGESPIRRPLGPYGAVSAVASSKGWTARAYPQADVITLEAPDGRTATMRCYSPVRLAWADDALVVFAGDQHVMFFEHLLGALEGRY